jgi:hypothetical protein
MKKTLIALAAAATVSLGTLGAASAASTGASTAALEIGAQSNAAVQKVGYRFRYYGGYGYGYRYCKHLYYKGWVLDFYWARVKYYRNCTYRYRY